LSDTEKIWRRWLEGKVNYLTVKQILFIVKDGEIEKFALKIIAQRLNLEDIANWFKRNTKKI